MPQTPLQMWTRAFLVLGAVLAVVAFAPGLISIAFLSGQVTVLPMLALLMVGPLAVLALVAGALLWLYAVLTRRG